MGGAAAASAAMELAGSIGGWISQGVSRAQARRALEGVVPPEVADELYEAALVGDPEKINYIAQQYPSLMSYVEDPKLRLAQTQALEQLQQVGAEGWTPEDQAALQAANMQAGVAARGQREALGQQMAMRGIGGSGMDLARQQMTNQASANQMFNQAAGLGMAGRERALGAIQSAGQLGGQMRGQEFGQAAQKSAVQQAIDQANIANRMTTQQSNVANQMQVNLANQQAKIAQAQAHDASEQGRLGLDLEKAKYGERKYG